MIDRDSEEEKEDFESEDNVEGESESGEDKKAYYEEEGPDTEDPLGGHIRDQDHEANSAHDGEADSQVEVSSEVDHNVEVEEGLIEVENGVAADIQRAEPWRITGLQDWCAGVVYATTLERCRSRQRARE